MSEGNPSGNLSAETPNRVPGAQGLYNKVETSEYSGFTLNPYLIEGFACLARS